MLAKLRMMTHYTFYNFNKQARLRTPPESIAQNRDLLIDGSIPEH